MPIGHNIGDTPPGLAEDGSFETALPDTRAYSIVSEEGKILVVDKNTKTLIEEPEDAAQ